MRHAFQAPADAATLRPEYLAWKYFAAGPSWRGSRSYVLCDGQEIVAHAAIWPVRLRLDGELRDGISFGDWVTNEQHRGAGLVLLRKLMLLSPFVLVTGGAPITRAILPRAGFQPWAERTLFARVLRPTRQLFTRGKTMGWKEPLRVARNTAWSLPPLAGRGRWTAEPAEVDERLLSLVAIRSGSVQTAAYLRYMLACPGVRFQFLAMRRGDAAMGYALLGFAGGQGRVCEIRLGSDEPADWSAAMAAVVRTARRDPRVCEVIAFGSTPQVDAALRANGFRARGTLPVVICDPKGTMVQHPLPQLGMLEDDASTLLNPAYPYRT